MMDVKHNLGLFCYGKYSVSVVVASTLAILFYYYIYIQVEWLDSNVSVDHG